MKNKQTHKRPIMNITVNKETIAEPIPAYCLR